MCKDTQRPLGDWIWCEKQEKRHPAQTVHYKNKVKKQNSNKLKWKMWNLGEMWVLKSPRNLLWLKLRSRYLKLIFCLYLFSLPLFLFNFTELLCNISRIFWNVRVSIKAFSFPSLSRVDVHLRWRRRWKNTIPYFLVSFLQRHFSRVAAWKVLSAAVPCRTLCPRSFGTLTEHAGRRRPRWDSSDANWLMEIRSFWG